MCLLPAEQFYLGHTVKQDSGPQYNPHPQEQIPKWCLENRFSKRSRESSAIHSAYSHPFLGFATTYNCSVSTIWHLNSPISNASYSFNCLHVPHHPSVSLFLPLVLGTMRLWDLLTLNFLLGFYSNPSVCLPEQVQPFLPWDFPTV